MKSAAQPVVARMSCLAPTTLSVYHPNYNHGHYLVQALDSVVTQCREPNEFLSSMMRQQMTAYPSSRPMLIATPSSAFGVANGIVVCWPI